MGTVQIPLLQLIIGVLMAVFFFSIFYWSWLVERKKRRDYEKLVELIERPRFYHMLAEIAAEKWRELIRAESRVSDFRNRALKEITPSDKTALYDLDLLQSQAKIAKSSYEDFMELINKIGFKVTPAVVSDKYKLLKLSKGAS